MDFSPITWSGVEGFLSSSPTARYAKHGASAPVFLSWLYSLPWARLVRNWVCIRRALHLNDLMRSIQDLVSCNKQAKRGHAKGKCKGRAFEGNFSNLFSFSFFDAMIPPLHTYTRDQNGLNTILRLARRLERCPSLDVWCDSLAGSTWRGRDMFISDFHMSHAICQDYLNNSRLVLREAF